MLLPQASQSPEVKTHSLYPFHKGGIGPQWRNAAGFLLVAVPLGRCGMPLSSDNVLIGKNPFHHPCYRCMQLLFSSCVILIITKDEIQSKAQYLRCYDLLEIQVWGQDNSLSG